ERLRKWVWRRRAAAGLLAAVALLAVAGGAGTWLLHQQATAARARQAQADRDVDTLLERARGHLEEGWQAGDLAILEQANAAGSHADDVARSGGASAGARQQIDAFRQDAAALLARAQKNRALLADLQDVSVAREPGAVARRDEAGRPMPLAEPTGEEQ